MSIQSALRLPTGDSCLEDRAIGRSFQWREVLRQARRVAATDTTVCLHGETGTGKEVLARLIHIESPRRSRPFVGINCAAMPEQLLESELFGFERGAFTDARQAKPGQIELAAGGVLFLDEIGEMTASAQAKFLRVLQEREFLRLGGTRPVKADIRVIVATNRNLSDAVAQGEFRADLYYRVHVFDITIPPLRERRDDIMALADSFLREFGDTFGGGPIELTPAAKQQLLSYDWPGNVRELRNVLERASILCENGMICSDDLSLPRGARPTTRRTTLTTTTDLLRLERGTIQQVMHDTDGNKTLAARQLGISRSQLYVRLRRHGLAV